MRLLALALLSACVPTGQDAPPAAFEVIEVGCADPGDIPWVDIGDGEAVSVLRCAASGRCGSTVYDRLDDGALEVACSGNDYVRVVVIYP